MFFHLKRDQDYDSDYPLLTLVIPGISSQGRFDVTHLGVSKTRVPQFQWIVIIIPMEIAIGSACSDSSKVVALYQL